MMVIMMMMMIIIIIIIIITIIVIVIIILIGNAQPLRTFNLTLIEPFVTICNDHFQPHPTIT